MSHSYELPNGTEALVLTNSAGCVRLIKTYHCWKRIWLAGEGVQLIIDCDREVVSEPGFGAFLVGAICLRYPVQWLMRVGLSLGSASAA